jgi:hypothetical protein
MSHVLANHTAVISPLLCLRKVLKAWNAMSSAGDSVDLEELEDYSDFMQKLKDMDMTWVILAYVAMVGATKTCPDARGAGDDLSLKNPLHGLLFWFMVLEFLSIR